LLATSSEDHSCQPVLERRAMRTRVVFILVALTSIAFVPPSTRSIPQHAQTETISDLFKQLRAAARRKDYSAAAQLLEEVIATGRHHPSLMYDAACWWARAGNKDKAFQLLLQSIDSGYHNAAHLQRDSDLLSLHDDARWAKATAASEQQEKKYVKHHSDPNKARLITSDIALFWKAYDHAMAAEPKDRAAIFQREYIEQGSVGLEDLNAIGRIDAEGLAKTIEDYPNYYRAIRTVTLNIEQQRPETIAAFRKLKALYPPATFPETYFAIGQFGGGGKPTSDGLLIGAEMFARAAGVPTRELGQWENEHALPPTDIPPVVAHEFVHFLQAFGSQESVLCTCLNEGSADFISEVAVGRLMTTTMHAHEWANQREQELWKEFQKDMNGTDASHWLYAGSGKGGRPDDLGYWMGYKIVEAYYKNASDKEHAIKDMLTVKNCSEFLKASRYAEKF
jgi:Predicted Zn-dependent protease (DUF2268)